MTYRVSVNIRIASDNPASVMVSHQSKSVEFYMDAINTEAEFIKLCTTAWLAYVSEIGE